MCKEDVHFIKQQSVIPGCKQFKTQLPKEAEWRLQSLAAITKEAQWMCLTCQITKEVEWMRFTCQIAQEGQWTCITRQEVTQEAGA